MSETYYRINEEAFTTISRDRTRLLIMEGVFVPVEPGRFIDIHDPKVRERTAKALAYLRWELRPDYGNADWLLATAAGEEGDDECR